MELQKIVGVGSKFLISAALIVAVSVAVAAPTTKYAGTYSSLAYNAESGDLTGYEVRIIPSNQGLKAVVQVAEGDAGRVYIVDVIKKNSNTLSFAVPLASGIHATFTGTVSALGLDGVISFPSGHTQKIFLKRSISYWER